VRVTTANGTYGAEHLVLAAGAWMPELMPAVEPHLWIERNVARLE
jgi:glycine/D-amino acid oxidase-like deaminating enzyme